MKSAQANKIAALVLTAAMTGSVFSAMPTISAEEINISNDFEENADGWGPRGENEVVALSTEKAHSGESSLCVSEREKSWNGASFAVDGILKTGEEYMVTAYAMTEWYNTLTLSKQYDDAEGTTHYENILSQQNDGSDWSEYNNIKFSFPDGATNMSIYFESSDPGSKIYIDDFSITTAPDVAIETDIPSLKYAFQDYFKVGTAITPSDLASKPFMKLVDRHFSASITVGNELKPDYVLDKAACQAYFEENGDDTNPQVTLASAKPVLDYCLKNNIPVRGHTLVWHSQTPAWFFKEGYADDGEWVTKEKMIERMENYIKNVMETIAKEYPDLDVYAWDVVNEAWEDGGTPRQAGANENGNGSSGWVKVFGDNSFIEYAFKFARQYAPEGTMLYYNDYNEYIDGKTNAIYDMAMDLKEKGLIDGIGMQSHLDVGFPSASQYRKALEKFASTGLDIQITELDITITKDNPSEENYQKQAEVYKDIFQAIIDNKDSVSAVILWGVTDDKSWRASQYPLLFDSDFKAKPAFYSVAELGNDYETTTATDEITDSQTTTESSTDSEETSETTTVADETTDSQTTIESNTDSAETSESTSINTTAKLLGDANADGFVDIKDIAIVSQYIIQLKDLSEEGYANANVIADNSVDIKDLSQIKRYLINEIDKF